jgi:CHAT domain-containing protein
LVRETFAAAQWSNETSAGAAVTRFAERYAQGDATLAPLVRERQELTTEWQTRDKELVAALARTLEDRNGITENETRARLAAIELRLTDIELRLKGNPRYARAPDRPLSVEEVQALLAANEALVTFVSVRDFSVEDFAWVVTKTEARMLRLSVSASSPALLSRKGKQVLGFVTSDPLDLKTLALRCGLDFGGMWLDEQRAARCQSILDAAPIMGRLPFDLGLAHELYRELFGGLTDLIKDKHLLIVPSPALMNFPFAVLVTEKPAAALANDPDTYRRTAWFMRKYPVAVLPSVGNLSALRRIGKSDAPNAYIGFGNPLIDGDPDDRKRAEEARAWQSCTDLPTKVASTDARSPVLRGKAAGFFRGSLADVDMLRHQPPLPETADELCKVARSLGAGPADVYLGARATERMVKDLSAKGALSKVRAIHFATHGLLAGETAWFLNGRLEPALLLTPPAKASDEDDGLLTTSEIAALKLNADWVILSACNTASAENETAEGLSGLARAFFFAGARALLVSHWSVNSAAATDLTTAAMAALSADPQIGRSEALRRAMLELLDRGGVWAHPSMWAPFVVIGDG